MRIIARRAFREFWTQHANAEQPLRAWFTEVKTASWKGPVDIKQRYSAASFVGADRVVFNIGGNEYRLVVAVRYNLGIVFIRFVGTHAAYRRIDVTKV